MFLIILDIYNCISEVVPAALLVRRHSDGGEQTSSLARFGEERADGDKERPKHRRKHSIVNLSDIPRVKRPTHIK